MMVYVCTRYGEQGKELQRAWDCCAKELELGNVPFAPQLLYPQFAGELDGSGMLLGLEMLPRLDAVHVYGRTQGERMRREIACARCLDMPVHYMDER